jgi:hypothetical protein
MSLKPRQISLNLPFGIGGVQFIADESQQRAAWALYVELMTRISVQPLDERDPAILADDDGILREALKSLYDIFQITREIIKAAGPEISDGEYSVGPIAIRVLNDGLRPFLAKWHPQLKDWENRRPADKGEVEHEREWKHYSAMMEELKMLQGNLAEYAELLAQISGAKLADKPDDKPGA